MFRHMMKLIWKRKSRNLMLSLEILLAFLIVFAIAAACARYNQLYRLPLGFAYQDVWSVNLTGGAGREVKLDGAVFDRFKRSLAAMPQIENVAYSTFSPYQRQTMRTDFVPPGGGARIEADMLDASDDYFQVTGMRLLEGRWYSAVDDGAATVPVVITRSLAEKLYPGQSAVGREFSDSEPDAKKPRMLKVTGVIEAFRSHGELMTPVHFIFLRFAPPASDADVNTIMLKVRPGTERAFEEALVRQLKLVRNDLSYAVAPLPELRASRLREDLTPLVIMAVIAAFMLAMVGFGLFGVLWQNTTQRIPEIGLRRAIGASRAQIYGQIIGEQLLLSSAAMAVALMLLVQLPITGALGASLNWQVFLTAAALSMAVIYLISLLCSLYPGWRASRLSPTEALHYE
ncbi:ABC transporter permease [Massilia eurypsychrophila]|uniref:ABC transporter permease n=2 Tax=Massilia eurypsychrophila TaxID=1485217 RepID=A0A2G8TDX7_9BURK|nr:ABC transporter permease [Massilia eurypsychrophila]